MSADASQRTDHADEHVDIDELADFAESLVPPERAAAISQHLTDCAQCRSDVDALGEVHRLLADAPTESMPDEVFARLQDAVSAEQQRREADHSRHRLDDHPGSPPTIGTGRPPYVDDSGRPSIQGGGRFPKPNIAEHFTDTKHRRGGVRARFATGAVAAALVASIAGFGGYVLSAASGTDEPSTEHPIVAENQHVLASSAASAAAGGDLDPHRFTKAWLCARKVTDGSITGIRATVLDNQPGYLVFLGSGSTNRAVFVYGCDTGTPTAGPTIKLPQK